MRLGRSSHRPRHMAVAATRVHRDKTSIARSEAPLQRSIEICTIERRSRADHDEAHRCVPMEHGRVSIESLNSASDQH